MKNVKGFVDALEAYLDAPLSQFNKEQLAEHAQDLLTDLEHWQDESGVRVDERQAHLRYLQEAGRCFGCGMTLAEIQSEYAAELETLGPDDSRLMPMDECPDAWDRIGEKGPHSWNEFPLPRKAPQERIGFYTLPVMTENGRTTYEAVCPVHGTSGGRWAGTTVTDAIMKAEREHKHE